MMLLPLDTMRLKREKIGLISEHLCRTTPPAPPKTLSNPHPLINPPPPTSPSKQPSRNKPTTFFHALPLTSCYYVYVRRDPFRMRKMERTGGRDGFWKDMFMFVT